MMIDYSCPFCENGNLYFTEQEIITKEYSYKFTQKGKITKKPKVNYYDGDSDFPNIILCDNCGFQVNDNDILENKIFYKTHNGTFRLEDDDLYRIKELFELFWNRRSKIIKRSVK